MFSSWSQTFLEHHYALGVSAQHVQGGCSVVVEMKRQLEFLGRVLYFQDNWLTNFKAFFGSASLKVEVGEIFSCWKVIGWVFKGGFEQLNGSLAFAFEGLWEEKEWVFFIETQNDNLIFIFLDGFLGRLLQFFALLQFIFDFFFLNNFIWNLVQLDTKTWAFLFNCLIFLFPDGRLNFFNFVSDEDGNLD